MQKRSFIVGVLAAVLCAGGAALLVERGAGAAGDFQPVVGSPTLTLASDPGDQIGQGRHEALPNNRTSLIMSASPTEVDVRIERLDEQGRFEGYDLARFTVSEGDVLRPGVFGNAQAMRSVRGRVPAMEVTSDNQRQICLDAYGEFRIDQIERNGSGALTKLDLTFDQRCYSSTAPSFKGTLRLNAKQTIAVLDGGPGSSIHPEGRRTYLGATTVFQLGRYGDTEVSAFLRGLRDNFSLQIAAPGNRVLAPGATYTVARFADATHAGFDAGFDSRGCDPTGSMTIRNVEFDQNRVPTSLWLTFRVRCQGDTTDFVGEYRYNADRWVSPPGATANASAAPA